ncbi:MAG: amidase [Sphingomonas sp.]|nr:MAG: amidase [Sphingomonas sp.]
MAPVAVGSCGVLDRRRFVEMAGLAAFGAALGGAGRASAAAAAFDPATADASAMALAMKQGRVTSAALVETALTRLEKVNGTLNACRFLYADEARAAASQKRAGAVAGIPTFTKDLSEEKGRAFTKGCRAYADRVGGADGGTTAAMRAAGLISLGRSTTPEFGLLPTTEPLLGGPTRNPWNPAHSCGGSSGGAGALVAAGVVPFAHASDGGGSIRIPASANGLVGLKPSRARMAGEEGRKELTAVAVNGCLSRSVRDTAAWLAALEAKAGSLKPVGLVTGASRRPLRIGLRAALPGVAVHADVLTVFDSATALLKRLGHRPVEAPPPYDTPRVSEAFLALWSMGAAEDVRGVATYLGRAPGSDDVEPATLAFAARAAALTPEQRDAALVVLKTAVAAYLEQFDSFDVLMTPVLTAPPPEVGWMGPGVPFDTLLERVVALVAYTPMENVAGAPAISLPLGMSATGLPIGLQFSAPPGEERRLLELAYAIERARPWARLKPAVWAA